MSLLFTMRVIVVLSFYFTFANVLAVIFGGTPALFALVVLGATMYLGARLKHQLRFISLALLPLCFVVVPLYAANILLLLPAIGFVVFNIMNVGKISIKWNGKGMLKVYLVLAVLTAIFLYLYESYMYDATQYIGSVILPFAFILVTSTVLLLRTIRHKTELPTSIMFDIGNVGIVIGVFALGAFLGSEAVFSMIIEWLGVVYLYTILPAISFIFYLVIRLIGPVTQRFAEWHIGRERPVSEEYDMDMYGDMGEDLVMPPPSEFNYEIFAIAIFIIIAAIAIWIIVLIVKRFAKIDPAAIFRRDVITTEHYTGGKLRKKKPALKPPRGNERRLRDVYKRFLALCERNGIIKYAHLTSADYQQRFVDDFNAQQELVEFRNLYIHARYGEKEVDRAQVRQAKDLYKKIKKATKV